MKEKKFKEEKFSEFMKSLLFAILLAVIFRSFVYEPYRIPSASMKPLLIEGDNIFVSKFAYGFSRYSLPLSLNIIKDRVLQFKQPKRGDVIVFKGTRNNVTYIKRLIGMPGDKIQVINGILFINGEEIIRKNSGHYVDQHNVKFDKYIETLPNHVSYEVLDKIPNSELDNTPVVEVPKNSYFMMGDNRDQSSDSRVQSGIGFVPKQYLIGRAEIIFFSSNSPMWQIWTWFYDLNISRFFNNIKPKEIDKHESKKLA